MPPRHARGCATASPTPTTGHTLPDELVDLYPPRAQVALAALLERIEGDLRAPSVQAALRLAIVHMALQVSRLNGYPGRVAGLRISGGQVRGSSSRQWRERNAWAVFEEGTRAVRAFVQSLDAGGSRTPARVGPDLRALLDGSANVALRFGMPLGRETFGPPPRPGAAAGRPAARAAGHPPRAQPAAHPLVGGQPRLRLPRVVAGHRSGGRRDAAAGRHLRRRPALRVGRATRPRCSAPWRPCSRCCCRTRRSCSSSAVPSPEALVAAVIGGVGAGLRFDDAVLAETESGLDGSVVFALPRSRPPPAPGTWPSAQRPIAAAPFQLSAVEAAIADIAVAVIQLRGEPTRFDRILGEVLLGLDHLGHLRRLVGTPRPRRGRRTTSPRPRAAGQPRRRRQRPAAGGAPDGATRGASRTETLPAGANEAAGCGVRTATRAMRRPPTPCA